jgi:hypothetical protein
LKVLGTPDLLKEDEMIGLVLVTHGRIVNPFPDNSKFIPIIVVTGNVC